MDYVTKNKVSLSGAEILLESLINHGVDTVFGYPGGQIVNVYDKLPLYEDRLHHILVRHEQGAIHAAQGYARASHRIGAVMVTSGPGATNVVTGIADAMIDSTPVVVVAGQVGTKLLGTDAFQETDFIGLTSPISKWAYQIRRTEDIEWAVSRAFYIAGSGRPGPVVLDFTRDAQVGMAELKGTTCDFIRSYRPIPEPSEESMRIAASMINKAKKPFLVYGHGIILSEAEKELEAFLDKSNIPAGSTLLGLSALSTDNPHYKGMLGMHGNLATNTLTQRCDLLIAVGMRFDDRVTGNVSTYAKNAKIIHIDIDESEIGKIIKTDVGILGDAKHVLSRLTELIDKRESYDWQMEDIMCNAVEKHKVIDPEINPGEGYINPGEVVARVADKTEGKAIVVTDVGQNQMLAARYSRFAQSRSMITSGGLGTMGFGIPAAMGAKVAMPDRQVCLFVGDGGMQMTIQELGTIMQEGIGLKIILLNNNWLGNVRQWQELFYGERYSATRMVNPDYGKIASAYDIDYAFVEKREDLLPAIDKMLSDPTKPFILEVHVKESSLVFPMIAPGRSVDEIMLTSDESFEYGN